MYTISLFDFCADEFGFRDIFHIKIYFVAPLALQPIPSTTASPPSIHKVIHDLLFAQTTKYFLIFRDLFGLYLYNVIICRTFNPH